MSEAFDGCLQWETSADVLAEMSDCFVSTATGRRAAIVLVEARERSERERAATKLGKDDLRDAIGMEITA
jgi:hypothetical protein